MSYLNKIRYRGLCFSRKGSGSRRPGTSNRPMGQLIRSIGPADRSSTSHSRRHFRRTFSEPVRFDGVVGPKSNVIGLGSVTLVENKISERGKHADRTAVHGSGPNYQRK